MATRVSVRCVYRCCNETNGFCRWDGSRCHYTEISSRNKILEQHLPFGCFNFCGGGLVNIDTSLPTSQSLHCTPPLLLFVGETMWQSMKYIFPADDWRIERRLCYILYDWGWTWTSKHAHIVGVEHNRGSGRCFVNRELEDARFYQGWECKDIVWPGGDINATQFSSWMENKERSRKHSSENMKVDIVYIRCQIQFEGVRLRVQRRWKHQQDRLWFSSAIFL